MIQFLTDRVRSEFYKLPIESQRVWVNLARSLLNDGKFMTIVSVEPWNEDELEVTIRVDEKANAGRSV